MRSLKLRKDKICVEYIGINKYGDFCLTDGILPEGFLMAALIETSNFRICNISVTKRLNENTLSSLLYYLLQYQPISKNTVIDRWNNSPTNLGMLLMRNNNIDYNSLIVTS